MEAIARLSGGVVADPLLPDTVAEAVTWLRARRQGDATAPGERLFRVARRPRHALLTLVALLALAACAASRALRWRDTF